MKVSEILRKAIEEEKMKQIDDIYKIPDNGVVSSSDIDFWSNENTGKLPNEITVSVRVKVLVPKK